MEKLKELKSSFDSQEWADNKWTDRVLEILEDNEIAKDKQGKKYPRVRGLRRVGSYITDVNMVCKVVGCQIGYSACEALAYKRDCDKPIATSTAEATPENVNNAMIAKHLLATAESRAEGRCWTKVLKLNCLTAEEMSIGDTDKIENDEQIDIDEVTTCSDQQKKMINSKAKKLDINVFEYAKHVLKLEEMNVKEHIRGNTLSNQIASKIINNLDIIAKEEKEIPENLKGFISL